MSSDSRQKIRPIARADYPGLIELFREFALFEKRPEKMVISLERMEKDRDYIKGFVVENDRQELVGYVTCFYTFHTWTGKSMYMDDLYVQEKYRGAGLGKSLLNHVIDEARASECLSLRWLVSNWNNEAMEFYKGLGAEITNNEYQCELKLT